MQFFLKTLLFFSLALQNSFGASSSSQNHQLSGAKTALIASFYEQNGVQKLVAGVEFQLQEGWRIKYSALGSI
jgi:DsbC/DsbD-like thiol-disulfide interchange protein